MPLHAHGRLTDFVQRQGQKGRGRLLPDADQRVVFPGHGVAGNLRSQRTEAVGLSGHGRNHHHQLVALGSPERHPIRNVADLGDVGHRRSTIFLDNQAHAKISGGQSPPTAVNVMRRCVSVIVSRTTFR